MGRWPMVMSCFFPAYFFLSLVQSILRVLIANWIGDADQGHHLYLSPSGVFMSIDYGATGEFMILYLRSDIFDQLITLAFLYSSLTVICPSDLHMVVWSLSFGVPLDLPSEPAWSARRWVLRIRTGC